MNTSLKTVIDDYLKCVEEGMALFKQQIGEKRPLAAWRDYTISKEGYLSDEIEYQFHGVGCLLIFPEYEVDFDFGPDGRSDGFDLWRLTQYVKSRPSKYPEYQDEDKLEKDFIQAIKQGKIGKLDHPYCNLYYFASIPRWQAFWSWMKIQFASLLRKVMRPVLMLRSGGRQITADVITLDYYDGETEGFVSSIARYGPCYFKLVAWDDWQDDRVFAAVPISEIEYDEMISILTSSEPRPTSYYWTPEWKFEKDSDRKRADELVDAIQNRLRSSALLILGEQITDSDLRVREYDKTLGQQIGKVLDANSPDDIRNWIKHFD